MKCMRKDCEETATIHVQGHVHMIDLCTKHAKESLDTLQQLLDSIEDYPKCPACGHAMEFAGGREEEHIANDYGYNYEPIPMDMYECLTCHKIFSQHEVIWPPE